MKKIVLFITTLTLATSAFADGIGSSYYSGKAKLRMRDVYCITLERMAAVGRSDQGSEITDEQFALMVEIQVNTYKTQMLTVYGLAYSDQEKAYEKYLSEQKAKVDNLQKWIGQFREGKLTREDLLWLFNSQTDLLKMQLTEKSGDVPSCEMDTEHGSGRPGSKN